MVLKTFKLIGGDENDVADLEVDPSHDLDALRDAIAITFAIVEPGGIDLEDSEAKAIEEIEDVLSTKEPIGIKIDGNPIREPRGPEGLPVVGTYYEVFPDHLGNHQRMFETYGPVIKTVDMGRITYLTNDPACAAISLSETPFFTKYINSAHPLFGIKDNDAGLFMTDTDSKYWAMAHKFMTPALTPNAVRHYQPKLEAVVEKAFEVFDELDRRDEAFNVYPYMMKLGSQAIGKIVLEQDFHHFDSVDAKLDPLPGAIAEVLLLNKKVTSRGDWYANLPFGDPKRLKVVKKQIEITIEEAAANCPKGGDNDLPLKEAAMSATCIVDYINRSIDTQGNKLPRENRTLILSTVIGAGFVTTSSLLSWLNFCLVTYPDSQDRLFQELQEHGLTGDAEWSYDTISSLPFLDKFVKETQRLHNPSYQPGRTARIDCILPGGYRIPADAIVIPALHHIHNNPSVWDNPQNFDPDRWDTERVSKRHKCAYIPFAFGQRMCIGFNFALQEAKLFICKLVARYQLTKADDKQVEYDPMFHLIRPMNLYIRATRREQPKAE